MRFIQRPILFSLGLACLLFTFFFTWLLLIMQEENLLLAYSIIDHSVIVGLSAWFSALFLALGTLNKAGEYYLPSNVKAGIAIKILSLAPIQEDTYCITAEIDGKVYPIKAGINDFSKCVPPKVGDRYEKVIGMGTGYFKPL